MCTTMSVANHGYKVAMGLLERYPCENDVRAAFALGVEEVREKADYWRYNGALYLYIKQMRERFPYLKLEMVR